MKPVYTEAARRDLLEAASWYRSQSPPLARRFRDAVNNTVRDILDHPAAFERIDKERRRAVVRVFPYLVSFVWRDDRIIIVAVIHASRNPEYLLRRNP